MVCNVCGTNARCLELGEFSAGPPALGRVGMRFRICMDCLAKLIDPVKTAKTALESPADSPLPEQIARIAERMESARKIKDKKTPA